MGVDGWLLAKPQVLDQLLVALEVLALEVIEQTPAQADHAQETAPRVVVLGVRLQVLGEMSDALGEERDLNLGRPGIAFVLPVFLDRLAFAYGGDWHSWILNSAFSK